MTTEREALDRIAALCDTAEASTASPVIWVPHLRALLAQVEPARPGVLDTPPDGWFYLGSHVDWKGPLELSEEQGEDGLPKWERPLPGVLDREQARWVISETLMRVYDNGTSPNAVREAHAVLDDLEAAGLVEPVEAARPGVLDRDKARDVLRPFIESFSDGMRQEVERELLDRLAECVVERQADDA